MHDVQRDPIDVSGLAILRLAVPAALAAFLQHAFRPLDQLFVSSLGRDAQGAIGSTTFVVILVWALFVLISGGVGPLVARATGRKDNEARARVIATGLLLISMVYVAVGIAVVLGAGSISTMLGLEGDIATLTTTYLRVLYVTGFAMAIGPVIDAAMIGMGNTVLPLILQSIVLGINACLTSFFIFYMEWGVAGAALGTTIAQAFGVAVGLWFLIRMTGLRRAHLGFGPLVRKIMRIGAPLAMGTAMYALVYWALLATSVSKMGPEVNAALGIGFSGLEAMSWPLYMGVSVAVSSIIGRALGAGQPEQAWRTIRVVFWPQLLLGTIAGSIFYFFGPDIVGVFAADDEVLQHAALYATILAWSQPFIALEALFEGVMSGAGDTKRVFWGTVPFNIMRVPLAWVLAFPLGWHAAGIWWAINLTTYFKAGVKGWMVYRGEWSRIQL